MNQGVLYRYSPHAEVEEAQLVVPTHEREKILKLHHDAPPLHITVLMVPFQNFLEILLDCAVMQQLCFVLDINQSLIPVYHPQANPVERKNRDLKPRLAMMVGNNHTLWIEKLPAIRFALNTSKCESTDHTAAYLTFTRELRTLDQVNTDLRSVIHNDNFVPEFTPYLKRFEGYMSQIKENIEMSQDHQKTYADKSRRPSPNYNVNDLRSPTTFVVASCDKPDEPLGVYHTSALTPFLNGTETQSLVVPLKKRGRPRKQPLVPRGTAGEKCHNRAHELKRYTEHPPAAHHQLTCSLLAKIKSTEKLIKIKELQINYLQDLIEIETFDKDITDAPQLEALIKEKAQVELEFIVRMGELKVLFPFHIQCVNHKNSNGPSSFQPKQKRPAESPLLPATLILDKKQEKPNIVNKKNRKKAQLLKLRPIIKTLQKKTKQDSDQSRDDVIPTKMPPPASLSTNRKLS
ncbi:retrovirus-related Pol polyprotein from transposon 412 [Trichonephila clavipes]|nr:retrovirus-related Pol polyprotein from transposon 412 [Trichonephila clavipes]